MGKKGRSQPKGEIKSAKRSTKYEGALASEDMDDEIDAFHKQRDIVPLDINDDDGDSDEGGEHPIFGFEGMDYDDDDDEHDGEDDDDANNSVAKMKRQSKYLRAMFGDPEDEMHLDDEEDEEEQKHNLVGRKNQYGADNRDFELQSSDDDAPKEEEMVARQIRKDVTTSLTMADYGLEDTSEDETEGGLTLKEASVVEKDKTKLSDGTYTTDNDLDGSASELCHWLSELNMAHEQLECKINPFLIKVKNGEIIMKGGVQYFEYKQLVLLSYCQAITFYLLLKSEGQPVYGHPVIARLEEVKKLLDQITQLDENLPVQLEEILKGNHTLETRVKSDEDNAPTKTDVSKNDQQQTAVSAQLLEAVKPQEKQKVESLKDNEKKERRHKRQEDHIGMQSLEMFKVRASLEEKLKQKGLYGLIGPKPSSALKRLRPVNGQLETYDDFDDDAVTVEEAARLANNVGSSKISRFLNTNQKKLKVISGDDDIPKRDDIGERRRKHELRVLASAGIESEDYVKDEIGDFRTDEVAEDDDHGESGGSEDELYQQVKEQRAAKLAAKAATYSRNFAVHSFPETVEGKRLISHQMEKNKGLTPKRKKLIKNPRKKYKLKHQKAVKNRQGQVRNIRKATGPYGGESTGINATISRSIRFKG